MSDSTSLVFLVLQYMLLKQGRTRTRHRNDDLPFKKKCHSHLTDVNNYRAIAISNAITKLLEEIILKYLHSVNEADDYQFGFKKGFSTGTCRLRMLLSRLFSIIDSVAVTCSAVSSILVKHLTM